MGPHAAVSARQESAHDEPKARFTSDHAQGDDGE